MNKKTVGKKVEKAIARLAGKAASVEANTGCTLIAYQPKEPQKIKELRKF